MNVCNRIARPLAGLALGLGVGASALVGAGPAAAQQDCFFTAGFKALRDQIPDVVGQCLENEAFNIENGNAEQRTTGGLLVWRKADNWTAFTDGSTTWINGPTGLVRRPNAGPLFPWEAGQPASATPPAADPASLIEASVTRAVDGSSLDAHVFGNRTAVAYLGAEAPSVALPCGQEALRRNAELAGAKVLLEADPTYEFDARGLRLYYAYTADGISIEETLIREGLARAVRTDGRHGARLAALQREAEQARSGCLWRGTQARLNWISAARTPRS